VNTHFLFLLTIIGLVPLIRIFFSGITVWQSFYTLPVVSNRDFTFLILTRELATPSDGFLVVSIPVEAPPADGYVRGKYVSIEHVRQIDGNGVEWR
jgi:hypothetical protein